MFCRPSRAESNATRLPSGAQTGRRPPDANRLNVSRVRSVQPDVPVSVLVHGDTLTVAREARYRVIAGRCSGRQLLDPGASDPDEFALQ